MSEVNPNFVLRSISFPLRVDPNWAGGQGGGANKGSAASPQTVPIHPKECYGSIF